MRIAFFTAILILFNYGFAQPVLRKSSNNTIKQYQRNHTKWNYNSKQFKWGKQDTLGLPFLDDFVSTNVYPDSSKWKTNYVFINSDFPINPPSYGVATFDDLDENGNPYSELSGFAWGACDTLLSLNINLHDSSGKLYSLADSFVFSFFYQRQGNGDPSDSKDSIILQFKEINDNWNTVWKATGGTLTPFIFKSIAFVESKYFINGFQFRFINFSRRTGNTNQWHIDYVHLDKNRKTNQSYYEDFSIQSKPSSLLKNYSQMPYSHYLADSVAQSSDSIFFYAANLYKNGMNIQAKHTESVNGNIIISTNFLSNSANILPQNNAKRRFAKFSFNKITDIIFKIKREYQIIDANFSTLYPANDKITVYQEFGSCYAYDDGTAEYGFGYNDDVIDPYYKGAIAYKFNLTKSDTLWAVGMFFNQSVSSSKNIRFDVKGWQKITETGKGRNNDEELFVIYDQTPKFTDSVNGFHIFYLDTPILLPKGEFYIGWEQTGNYHLDVGYDINNGYHQTESSNNLFWADRGNWQSVSFKGALMIRPYIGKKVIYGSAKIINTADDKIKIYPNPAIDIVNIESPNKILNVKIFDNTGRLLFVTNENEISVDKLTGGVYTVQVNLMNGKSFTGKIIKLQ
ncbi:MAG: T9SS type A sorting domain-containing protein [Bacteroidia bacterium]|nr:T9SS type A sorting domain-containing protein [Bacteroidia bacterium]